MKRKAFCMFMIVLLMGTIPAFANGDREAEGSSPLKLTGWSYEVDTVNENLKIFSEQTGIEMEPYFNFPSNQFHDKLVTSFVAGTEFDVVYVRDSYLAEWASAEWIVPLDSYPGIEEIKKDISKGALDQMSYDGKLYGLPYYAGRRVMAYNETQIKQAGFDAPPRTWDELIEQARKIKDMGIVEYPIILDLNKSDNILESLELMTFGRGGKLFNDENDPLFDGKDGALKDSLEYVKKYMGDLIDPASLVSTDHETVRAISAGTRTFTFVSDYNLKTMNDPESSTVPGQIKMALVPGNGTLKSGSVGYIRFYSITADCKNKDAAYELVKFLGHADKNGDFFVAKKWALNFGLGFVQIPLFDDAEIQTEINSWGNTEILKEQDEYVVPRFYRFTPWFQEWQTAAWEELQKALIGDESVDSALKKMSENAIELKDIYK